MRIKCVGVWDTVGNIGNPFISSGPIGRLFKFHDTRLSDTIDVGLHALSIDEIRGPFRPALWALPKSRHFPRISTSSRFGSRALTAMLEGGSAKLGCPT